MRVSRNNKIFIIVTAFVTGLLVLYINAMKPPKSMKDEIITYDFQAQQFYSEFSGNETEFNSKYINQIIGLTGVITSVQDSIVILNDKIVCITHQSSANLAEGQLVKIKGRYIGYDELFDNLKLSECLLESL